MRSARLAHRNVGFFLAGLCSPSCASARSGEAVGRTSSSSSCRSLRVSLVSSRRRALILSSGETGIATCASSRYGNRARRGGQAPRLQFVCRRCARQRDDVAGEMFSTRLISARSASGVQGFRSTETHPTLAAASINSAFVYPVTAITGMRRAESQYLRSWQTARTAATGGRTRSKFSGQGVDNLGSCPKALQSIIHWRLCDGCRRLFALRS
jgi:hypothetical protein